MQKKLLFLSFIEGAAVMAAELCGAKLLAPVFGSSLYVWASVMGITLAALASGYFFGGLISHKRPDHRKKLFQILIAASLFLLLMPVISYYLIPRISYLPFLTGVVISTIILLFFPVFFLGASSPLFISIQLNQPDKAGKVSGTVYAVSTLGGIFATFISGFYLIPTLGLNLTLLIFGGILFVSSIIVLRFFKASQILLLAAILYMNLQFVYSKSNQLLVSDGLLGRLEVENTARNSEKMRLLKINGIVQTEMNLKSHRSVSDYVNLLDTLIPKSPFVKNALVLGLGGGLAANMLVAKNYNVTGVELDKRIIFVAQKYFYLDSKINSVCEDARFFLNRTSDKYDLVLFDVFKAEEQPAHVITIESLNKLKENLNDSALLFINWHGYTEGSLGKGTAVLINTLKTAGFNVSITSLSANQDYRNIILICSLKALPQFPYSLNEKLETVSSVNSDNKPVLEYYNAKANKTWRNSYLRYYQNYE